MYVDKQSFDEEILSAAVEVLRLISDPTRIKIILALHAHEELPVGSLAELVGKNPAGVSQHLAKLRMSRMVSTRHEGTSVFYRLTDEHAIALVLESLRQAEHALAHTPLPPQHHHHNA